MNCNQEKRKQKQSRNFSDNKHTEIQKQLESSSYR